MAFTGGLSIFIPTFNRCAHLDIVLKRFIEEISSIEGNLVDLHVVDNASEDETKSTVEKYSNIHPFVFYHQNSENIGLEGNIERCEKLCSREWIWLFGDDDRPHVNSLAAIVSALDQVDDDAIFLNYRQSIGDDVTLYPRTCTEERSRKDLPLADFLRIECSFALIGSISARLFKVEILRDLDYSSFRFGSNYDHAARLLFGLRDKTVAYVAEPVLTQLQFNQRISFEYLKQSTANVSPNTFLNYLRFFEFLYQNIPGVLAITTLYGDLSRFVPIPLTHWFILFYLNVGLRENPTRVKQKDLREILKFIDQGKAFISQEQLRMIRESIDTFLMEMPNPP